MGAVFFSMHEGEGCFSLYLLSNGKRSGKLDLHDSSSPFIEFPYCQAVSAYHHRHAQSPRSLSCCNRVWVNELHPWISPTKMIRCQKTPLLRVRNVFLFIQQKRVSFSLLMLSTCYPVPPRRATHTRTQTSNIQHSQQHMLGVNE